MPPRWEVSRSIHWLDAVASVRPQLKAIAKQMPGLRLIPERFMAINQAMGTPRGCEAGARYLHAFIVDMKASGFVAQAFVLRPSGEERNIDAGHPFLDPVDGRAELPLRSWAASVCRPPNARDRVVESPIFQGEPCYSLMFSKGAEQGLHQDTCVFHIFPRNFISGHVRVPHIPA